MELTAFAIRGSAAASPSSSSIYLTSPPALASRSNCLLHVRSPNRNKKYNSYNEHQYNSCNEHQYTVVIRKSVTNMDLRLSFTRAHLTMKSVMNNKLPHWQVRYSGAQLYLSTQVVMFEVQTWPACRLLRGSHRQVWRSEKRPCLYRNTRRFHRGDTTTDRDPEGEVLVFRPSREPFLAPETTYDLGCLGRGPFYSLVPAVAQDLFEGNEVIIQLLCVMEDCLS